MEKEKLREVKLTKATKYTLLTAFLIGAIGLGVTSIDRDVENPTSEVVNSGVEETPKVEEEIVVKEEEKLALPFKVNAQIKTYYYDLKDDANTREKALVYYNGTYTPSMAVDYFYNNQNFEVVASFSGKVIDKKVDPMYGVTLYISNDNGLMAVYSSLSDVKVSVGDIVKQGDVIAKAGSNTINSNMGNHLNFALLKDDKHINPLTNFSKNVKDI